MSERRHSVAAPAAILHHHVHSAERAHEFHHVSAAAAGQAEMAENDELWKSIAAGNIQAARTLLTKDASLVNKVGQAGETALLWCYLHNTPQAQDIAKIILDIAPDAIAATYKEGEYEGENALHIAIAHGDFALVKFLTQRRPALVNDRATGAFFRQGGDAYLGELPLSFAACLNRGAIVEHLVRVGARISDADSHGNTAAHMCAYHGRKEMYDLLAELWNQGLGRPACYAGEFTLRHLANVDGHSPIVLAAAHNNQEMFEHLWDRQRKFFWNWAYITAWNYPLDYVDTLAKHIGAHEQHTLVLASTPSAHKGLRRVPTINAKSSSQRLVHVDDPPCTLEVITSGNCADILNVDKILQILDYKWEKYARSLFFCRLGVVLAFIIIFLLMAILRADLPDDRRVLQCPASALEAVSLSKCRGAMAMESLVLICAVVRAALDIARLCRLGIRKYLFKAHGATLMEHLLSWASWVSLLVAFVIDSALGRTGSKVPFSMASIFSWAHLLWFLLPFRLTGPFVIILYHMLLRDVVRFLVLLVIIMLGFTQALVFLGAGNYGDEDFSFEATLRLLVNKLLQPELEDPSMDRFMLLPMLAYCFLAPILLLNLLVAQFNSTFTRIMEDSEKRWHLERARIILALESDLPIAFRVSTACKYWSVTEGRPFLQALSSAYADLQSEERVNEVKDTLQRVQASNPRSQPTPFMRKAHSLDVADVFVDTLNVGSVATGLSGGQGDDDSSEDGDAASLVQSPVDTMDLDTAPRSPRKLLSQAPLVARMSSTSEVGLDLDAGKLSGSSP